MKAWKICAAALGLALCFSALSHAREFGYGITALPPRPAMASGTKGVINTIGTINVTRNITSGAPAAGSIQTTTGTMGPAGFTNMPSGVSGFTGFPDTYSERQAERFYSDRQLRRMMR